MDRTSPYRRTAAALAGALLALLLAGSALTAIGQVPTTKSALTGPSAPAGTMVPAAYVPMVAASLGPCMPAMADDFSDPTSGWPTGARSYGTYEYVNGVYRMTDTSLGGLIHMTASPDWSTPDVFTVSVEAWIPEGQDTSIGFAPAVGIVYGVDYFMLPGQIGWVRWYDFAVQPATQRWVVRKWTSQGDTMVELASGNSTAIAGSLAAHQQLEVRRDGATVTVLANGTVLGSVTDTVNPILGQGLVGVAGGDMVRSEFDNFAVVADGCIQVVTPAASAQAVAGGQ